MKIKKETNLLLEDSNGFQTHVWGPIAWFFLHTIAMNYDPGRHKEGYIQFFKSLQYVLPCKTCRDNYTDTIKTHKTLTLNKEVFKSRKALSVWVYRLHNYVRECQNKKKLIFQNNEADFHKHVVRYHRYRAQCLTHKQSHTGCTKPIRGGIRLKSRISVVPRCRQHK